MILEDIVGKPSEPVKLVNEYGEWHAERTAEGSLTLLRGNNVLRGGPLDGTPVNDLPDGTIVYVGGAAATAEPAQVEEPDPLEEKSGPVNGVADYVASWMEVRANDSRYGYAWGGWGPYDYDCGHAIIAAVRDAGLPLQASYTGDMPEGLQAVGYRDVTRAVNLQNGHGMQRGDILINRLDHAAVYSGNGKLVHARSSEGNTISGDQNGAEWRIQTYFNYPWTNVMRFMG